MSYVQIFNQAGAVSLMKLDDTKPLITIATVDVDESSEKPRPNVFIGNAPKTGIVIKRLTDHNVTKSLGGDFLLSTFGDAPVDIQLSGLNIFATKCDLGLGTPEYDDIMDFYEKNKVSTNPKKRIDITVSSGASKPGKVFRCALIRMTAQSANDPEISNLLYTYSLSLIGVRR